MVFAERLQEDGDQGHDGLHNAELQRGLGVGEGLRMVAGGTGEEPAQ